MELSLESYKGTRDFYPEDQRLHNYLFHTMQKVVEKFGFAQYNASILEETALYKAKSGEEIVGEQTYSFVDRGDREVTIRPEMTPTVARMVAKRRQELGFPLRWYSWPNLFRYERPQRGRLREHWQLNVDTFGLDSIEAEAELIEVASNIMTEFGASNADFIFRLNHRQLTNEMFGPYLGLAEDLRHRLIKLIDRMNKMDTVEFVQAAKDIVGAGWDKLEQLLAVKSVDDLPESLRHLSGAQELIRLQQLLTAKGIRNAEFDPTLMRGFDYYTGIVFEVFDTNPENRRSLFGGGRYDGLVNLFGVEPVSAVGFGMGDVTMHDFLDTHGLKPELMAETDVYLAVMSEAEFLAADELARELRQAGIKVEVDYSGRKLGNQIKTAEKHGVRYLIVLGSEEVTLGQYKLKSLNERTEQTLDKSGIIDVILKS